MATMDRELIRLAHEGDAEATRTWLEAQKKRPPINDLLWCALFATDPEVRVLLVEVATANKIKPLKKGWMWNDAIAAAILGDPEGIARAVKRKADFEAVTVTGTPLTTALRLGHVEFARALLEHGVDTEKTVKMAELRYNNPATTTVQMMNVTPFGLTLRDGNEETAALFGDDAIRPEHLGDAVRGGSAALIERVLQTLGKKAPLKPALFWSVHDPAVLPLLEKHGLDLSKLPTDTGTWGGPIWSYWAYKLRLADQKNPRGEADYVATFRALFATGVRATTAGLAGVIGANAQGIASEAMIDLFLEHGADLAEEMEFETDEWDDKKGSHKKMKGSIAEEKLGQARLDIVKYLVKRGAVLRPMRVSPDWRQSKEKSAWLSELGLLELIDRKEFPFLQAPGVDEVRAHLATEDGLVGVRLGSTRDGLAEDWDLKRATKEGFLRFGKDKRVESVYLDYYDLPYSSAQAFEEVFTAVFGKGKRKGAQRIWKIPGGTLTLRETHREISQHTLSAELDR